MNSKGVANLNEDQQKKLKFLKLSKLLLKSKEIKEEIKNEDKGKASELFKDESESNLAQDIENNITKNVKEQVDQAKEQFTGDENSKNIRRTHCYLYIINKL